MHHGLTLERIVQMLCLLTALLITPLTNATVANVSPRDGEATVLTGMWCTRDGSNDETIVQYSAVGLEVQAFTVLSESDPRRIGGQATMRFTIEAPNVFLRRDIAGADEVFSVDRDGLTVHSFWVRNRGTRAEAREAIAALSYQRCDVRKALQRAQAFLSSPKAEQATRAALRREAERKAQQEQWELEDAATEERRNASVDAYFTDLIQQLSQLRGSIHSAATVKPRDGALAYDPWSSPARGASGIRAVGGK